jgi:hypothetical protein
MKRPWIWGAIAFVLHALGVLCLCVSLKQNLPRYPREPIENAWQLFLLIDFPASCLGGAWDIVTKGISVSREFRAIYQPGLFFGVFGSTQYFVVSALFVRYLEARRRRNRRERGCCEECGYSLRGLSGNVCPECGTPLGASTGGTQGCGI